MIFRGNPDAPSAAHIGRTIAEKYRLVRILGVGGMGAVYEAVHEVTLRHVAVKLIHQFVVDGNSAAGARFLREAQAPASIGHPGIVDVLDAGQLPDGTLYLVFELLEGEEFEAVLMKRKLPPGDLVDIAIDVLDALSAAHQSGFIHRDIKPANVFLAKSRFGKRNVKLLDFGISKRIGISINPNITAQGAVVGTVDYMSPEQAAGSSIDARSDLWSVGALIYRALIGEVPFQCNTQLEMLQKLATQPVPSLADRRRDLPRELTAVVDRALDKDPSRRWQSAATMRDALRAFRKEKSARRSSSIRQSSTPKGMMGSLPKSGMDEQDSSISLSDFSHFDPLELQGSVKNPPRSISSPEGSADLAPEHTEVDFPPTTSSLSSGAPLPSDPEALPLRRSASGQIEVTTTDKHERGGAPEPTDPDGRLSEEAFGEEPTALMLHVEGVLKKKKIVEQSDTPLVGTRAPATPRVEDIGEGSTRPRPSIIERAPPVAVTTSAPPWDPIRPPTNRDGIAKSSGEPQTAARVSIFLLALGIALLLGVLVAYLFERL